MRGEDLGQKVRPQTFRESRFCPLSKLARKCTPRWLRHLRIWLKVLCENFAAKFGASQKEETSARSGVSFLSMFAEFVANPIPVPARCLLECIPVIGPLWRYLRKVGVRRDPFW